MEWIKDKRKNKKRCIFHIEENFYAAVARIAKKKGLSVSDLIRGLLRSVLAEEVQDGYSDEVKDVMKQCVDKKIIEQ